MKVGIVHIPKCAGTAVRSALAPVSTVYAGPAYHERDSFPTAHVETLAPEQRQTILTVKRAANIFERHDVIVAHASAPFFRAAGADHVVAVVREPRARLLSLYREWESIPPEGIEALGRRGRALRAATQGTFRDFLTSRELGAQIYGALARYLSGFAGSRAREKTAFVLTRRHGWRRPAVRHRDLDAAFWSHQIPALVAHLQAQGVVAAGSEISVAQERVGRVREGIMVLDRAEQHLLKKVTEPGRRVLRSLMNDGKLEPRTDEELDADYIETASRLGFVLAD